MRTIQTATQTIATRYFHTDHLGSIAVITNEAAAVVERPQLRRLGQAAQSQWDGRYHRQHHQPEQPRLHREEQLSVSGLVHLHGRVYDPIIARMTSADPTIPRPLQHAGVEPIYLRQQQATQKRRSNGVRRWPARRRSRRSRDPGTQLKLKLYEPSDSNPGPALCRLLPLMLLLLHCGVNPSGSGSGSGSVAGTGGPGSGCCASGSGSQSGSGDAGIGGGGGVAWWFYVNRRSSCRQ